MKNLSALLCYLLASFIATLAFADDQCEGKKYQDQRLVDQDFGIAFTPDDFLFSVMSPLRMMNPFHDYIRPWRQLSSLTRDLGSTIKTDKDKFQINLDVQHFTPDEITVKTSDGYIVIEAKHEEKKDDHGFVSRQFVRRYVLPDGTDPNSVVSQLSSDGVLTVSAPRKTVEGKEERVVPITPTGPARKEPKKKEEFCHSENCPAEN